MIAAIATLSACAPPQEADAKEKAFDRCIFTEAGVFHEATPAIIHDCRAASGMSAGTAETPKDGSGLQPASPTPKGDAQ